MAKRWSQHLLVINSQPVSTAHERLKNLHKLLSLGLFLSPSTFLYLRGLIVEQHPYICQMSSQFNHRIYIQLFLGGKLYEWSIFKNLRGLKRIWLIDLSNPIEKLTLLSAAVYVIPLELPSSCFMGDARLINGSLSQIFV